MNIKSKIKTSEAPHHVLTLACAVAALVVGSILMLHMVLSQIL
ncbi:MAG: hypothetical protein PSN37_05005 [Alphaproteobacteria bacterium]|nr:hypothetical protein [Alphaproteobacteria bacterium]